MSASRCFSTALAILTALAIIATALAEGESVDKPGFRTWTTSDGKYTTVAEFVGLENESVTIRQAGGQAVAVPLARLSQADQAFVRQAADFPNVIDGLIFSITDGDTVKLLGPDETQYKIRLAGIDAPEGGQDYGSKSRQALAEKIFKKAARIRWAEKDRYDRILGHIYLGDRWINKEMVEDGWAWHYKKYSSDPQLSEAEITARNNRAGLWGQPNQPIPPWDYRRPKPKPAEVTAQPTPIQTTPRYVPPPESEQPILNYWLNTSSNVRHNSTCKYFRNTKNGRLCGASDGKACGICGG